VYPGSAAASERWTGLATTVFQHIAQDSELPNAAIPTAFTQDKDGFLWIGSQNGLARWDGYNFRTYTASPGIPGSLPDNFISALHTDAQGRLWIASTSGGLARYDYGHDRFILYPTRNSGQSHEGVMAIVDDGASGIWVGTESGLDHISPETGITSHLGHRDGDARSLPDGSIRVLFRTREGALWLGTSRGLFRCVDGLSPFVEVAFPASVGKANEIASLFEDGKGRMWVGTKLHGAFWIEPGGTAARPVREVGQPGTTLAAQQVDGITEPRAGEVWLCTYGHGIVAVDSATLETRRIQHDSQVPSSLANDTVMAIFRDRAGLVWVGTDRSISRYDPQEFAVSTVFGTSSRRGGISDENVHFILPLSKGEVWIGAGDNGVDILDPRAGRIGELRPDGVRPASALPKAIIDVAVAAPNGDIYLGTQQGLYRTDRSAHKLHRLSLPPSDTTAIWALLLDEGILWIGGPDGVRGLDIRTGMSVPIRIRNGDQLTGQRLTTIERGPPGQLWIGTQHGLDRVDLTSQTDERILPDPADPAGLPAGYINSLVTDRLGRLWVGTASGISVLMSRDSRNRPRFRQLRIADGLPNNDINRLVRDNNGNIWVSTDNGLAVVDPTTFAVRALGRSAGVVVSNYWISSGTVTPDGEVLFGGIGGMTVVRPDRLTNSNYRPPVVITDIRVGGKAVLASPFNSTGDGDPLMVTPDKNNLLVEFSALDYSAPDRCRYAYHLDGHDKNWIETDAAHRLAAYSNLPPGDYTLRIRSSNRDGAWGGSEMALRFRVRPTWYQTLWFRFIELLASLSLLVALVQVRTHQLRRRQGELEQNVAERTAELEESKRQLERFAYFDFLTDLPNRRMFTDDFRRLLARAQRQNGHFALLLIDLNGFKQINDTYGHDSGDALLIEVASRIRNVTRESDSVARLGGDEFAILLADDEMAGVEQVCHRIRESFLANVLIRDASIKASLSIGVAAFPDHGETMDDLFKVADVALYKAKRLTETVVRWSYGSPPSHPEIVLR
jgi:diguanylate cyclase (GGDEF)-like protein